MRPRLTLSVVFWGSGLLLVGLLTGLLLYITRASDETIIEGEQRQRDTAMASVQKEVTDYLAQTTGKLNSLKARFAASDCNVADRRSVESCLLGTLISDVNLDVVTLTHAVRTGFDDDELPILAENDRWQLSVFRSQPGPDSPICSRWVENGGGGFKATTRCRGPHELLFEPKAFGPVQDTEDPTDHNGFKYPAGKEWKDVPTPSDLAWSESDLALPVTDRRVTVSMINKVETQSGDLIGVLKVGQVFDQLSEKIRTTRVNPDPSDPFHVFLCDAQGRLITGFAPKDVPVEAGEDDLRVDVACAPPDIKASLESALLSGLNRLHLSRDGTVAINGQTYMASFRVLPETQGWTIGVVGPQDFYRDKVNGQRARMLVATSIVLALVVLMSLLSLRAISRSLGAIVTETGRMHRFDFARSEVRSVFRDVRAVLSGLEHAKTAVRAMGRYVPLELVRQLFRDDQEPVPGGSLREVTVMFTDIEGFTTLVEKEPPDRVGAWLGHYFAVMTSAVYATGGIVDKFIGDAVMAMWNAPLDDAEHVARGCRAALKCVADTQALFASDLWQGRPPLVTRFGLHVTPAMVGNFGAPERLSYTAIGDGVNLGSRLEGLNKEYGTTLIVSDAVVQRVQGRFEFRRLDRVAVKGKAQSLEVYELLGAAGAARSAAVTRYEQALTAYFRRDFQGAAALLDAPNDPPSRVLKARCEQFLREPPPPDWDGVWTLHTK